METHLVIDMTCCRQLAFLTNQFPSPTTSSNAHLTKIRIDSISKQNGHQILFVEASAALNRGEKIGLVGPNGAGFEA